jgi:hypothetical protein
MSFVLKKKKNKAMCYMYMSCELNHKLGNIFLPFNLPFIVQVLKNSKLRGPLFTVFDSRNWNYFFKIFVPFEVSLDQYPVSKLKAIHSIHFQRTIIYIVQIDHKK